MLLKIAWRSLWRNRRRTLITVISIVLGLTISIFFISMGEGVYDQMIDQAVRMQAGHVTIQHSEYADAPAVDLYIQPGDLTARIEALGGVERTKPLIIGQGIAKSGAGTVAAGIMGVTPSIEAAVSPLARNIIEGSYLEDDDGAKVVLGARMAERLNLAVGKKLVISTNDINGDLVSQLARVKGIFQTGSDEMDAYFIQVPIGFARTVFGMPEDAVTRLGIVLESSDRQEKVLKAVEGMNLGSHAVALPWQVVMPDVAAYIRVDKASNWVFQGILIFLILFTIFNTILMSVLERQREFAMLLAIGTPPALLKKQVVAESALIALIGCFIGAFIGAGLSWLTQIYGIDFSSVMAEGTNVSGFAISTKIHPKPTADIVLGASGVVFIATMIMSLLPMRRAARIDIVDTLR